MEKLKLDNQGEELKTNQQRKQIVVDEVCRLFKQKRGRIETARHKDQYVVIYGDKEFEQKDWKVRTANQRKTIENILDTVDDSDRTWANEIMEIRRLGKFRDGKARPIRVKFAKEETAQGILRTAYRLKDNEDFRNIKIKELMDEEDRAKLKSLLEQATKNNEQRTEEEKNTFFGGQGISD